MFKVECPGCKASYNVDERRVPAGTGMKMRCPKCSTTFQVKRPGEVEAEAALPVVRAPAPVAAPVAPVPAPPPARVRKATVIGLGGLSPGLPGAPAPMAPPSRQVAPASDDPEADLLPAVVMPRGRITAAPPPPAPAPARPGRTSPFDDLDLPAAATDLPVVAPRGGATRSQTSAAFDDLDSDIDLPVPRGAPDMLSTRPGSSLDLTAHRPDLEMDDLPVVRGASPPDGADLPVPARGGGADLPARRGPSAGAAGRPLPAGKSERQITGGVLFDDLDLPEPVAPNSLDLPSIKGMSDLPAVRSGAADLPAVRGGSGADLPSIKSGPDLPAVKFGGDLPAAKDSGGFGEIDLPMNAASLPTPAAGLPAPAAALPSRPASAVGRGAGDLDFGDLPPVAPQAQKPLVARAPSLSDFEPVPPPADFSGFDDDPFGAPPAPPPRPAPVAPAPAVPVRPAAPPAAQRQAGGGTSFGEVDLGAGSSSGDISMLSSFPDEPAAASDDAGWGERDLGGGGDDDEMEFDAIPQEKSDPTEAPPSRSTTALPAPSAPPPSVPAADRTRPAVVVETAPVNTARRFRIAAAALLAILAVGGALTVTSYGPFGYNVISDALHARDYEAQRVATAQEIRTQFAHDTATAAAQAVSQADAAQTRSPRATGVTALAAYAAYLREIRFGHDATVHAHASTLLASLNPDSPPPGYELARAAQAGASEQLARGQSQIDAYLRRNPSDADALGLAGEMDLAGRDADKALAHWTKFHEVSPSPRSLFGLARANLLKHDATAARDAAQKVLAQEPNHLGSLLLLARMAWDTGRDEATATRLLDQALAQSTTASREELVRAYTLKGQIQLNRSRVTAAEGAFNEALKLDPKASSALEGMGEALYRAGRFAEALARFQSALGADPDDIAPKIGVAKTQLSLERLQEAKDLLKTLDRKLHDEKKPNLYVLHWKGRVGEALGDRASAEADYNEAIKIGGTNPDVVEPYIALAQLLTTLGRPAEAQNKLDEARARLPRSVTLFKALGDMSSQAGRYTEAEAHYQNALQLDPQDLSTRFRLGITQRRLGRFDDAAQSLDKVTQADKDYPGLALERAVLYEASGQSAKAVELYEGALTKAPNDPDLMLRVAAALLAANQPGQLARAEELLRKVLSMRQNSAEANHFLGRALLLKGTNLAEALRYLKRATDLDPNRAEYFLYVGWAANEADDQGLASSSLARALDLDKSLADAYWQRGVLLRRQRALPDAEADLQRALVLRPSRHEAHATLAEVYEDQQKWPAAQVSWQKAIAADGKQAYWRFRLGKLLYQHGSRPAALEHLTQAVQLASQSPAPPPWMAEACLLLGDVERQAGKKDLAIEHLQRFLSLAPMDSPYRADAEKYLELLGVRR